MVAAGVARAVRRAADRSAACLSAGLAIRGFERPWRRWLERHALTQPFKQAHREVYIVTDAERTTETYSNRFAAHILRQHQLKALCEQRGWRMRLQGGGFDPGDCMPRLDLPRWNLSAEFWVEGIEAEQSSAGISLYVATGQVRFGRQGALLAPPWLGPPLLGNVRVR